MPSEAAVLALHGFTQAGAAWAEVAVIAGGSWITPDLPGHGGPHPTDWDTATEWVAGLLEGMPAPRVLVGYSMGGRLALGALVAGAPAAGAVLVSASGGIADPGDRITRIAADDALAADIRRWGTARFVEKWLARPMFAGLSGRDDGWRAADRSMRASRPAEGLAAALAALGQGAQPLLLDRLGEVGVPVALVVGERDGTYRAKAAEMADRLPYGVVTTVAGAGHAVVAEQPGEVAAVVIRMRRLVLGTEHVFD